MLRLTYQTKKHPSSRTPTLVLSFLIFGGCFGLITFYAAMAYMSGSNTEDVEQEVKPDFTKALLIAIGVGLFVGLMIVGILSIDQPN
jgi:predicted MFS family arabinose efflux permease